MKQRVFRLSRNPRMTLAEFGAAVGVHLVTACCWENGQIPSPKCMNRILEVFPQIRADDYYNDKMERSQQRERASFKRNACSKSKTQRSSIDSTCA